MAKVVETDNEIVVGLDVGSSTVHAIIGEVLPDRRINILGVGTQPSEGITRGSVTDVEKVVESIKRATQAAELSANCQISSVYCAISGSHIQSFNETGMVSINDEVTQDDVDTAIHTAKTIKLPVDCNRLLHAMEQNYKIDSQSGIRNPIGITGCRMQAFVHLIACHSDTARNLEKCVSRVNNLKVDSLVFSGLASSHAVLSQDEKDIGVCMVDIGGGTMDMVIYTDGMLRYSGAIRYAGSNASKDVATAFSTPFQVAESLKVRYGTVDLEEYRNNNKTVVIRSVSGEEENLDLETVSQVLNSRYKELLELVLSKVKEVQRKLKEEHVNNQLGAGIVITGGGANMKGLLNLARSVFSCQVRIGRPGLTMGLTETVNKPEFATAVGLLIHGVKYSDHSSRRKDVFGKNAVAGFFKSMWQKIKDSY